MQQGCKMWRKCWDFQLLQTTARSAAWRPKKVKRWCKAACFTEFLQLAKTQKIQDDISDAATTTASVKSDDAVDVTFYSFWAILSVEFSKPICMNGFHFMRISLCKGVQRDFYIQSVCAEVCRQMHLKKWAFCAKVHEWLSFHASDSVQRCTEGFFHSFFHAVRCAEVADRCDSKMSPLYSAWMACVLQRCIEGFFPCVCIQHLEHLVFPWQHWLLGIFHGFRANYWLWKPLWARAVVQIVERVRTCSKKTKELSCIEQWVPDRRFDLHDMSTFLGRGSVGFFPDRRISSWMCPVSMSIAHAFGQFGKLWLATGPCSALLQQSTCLVLVSCRVLSRWLVQGKSPTKRSVENAAVEQQQRQQQGHIQNNA